MKKIQHTLIEKNIFELFVKPDEVVEVRILGAYGKSSAWDGFSKGTVSGYFDNFESFCKSVKLADTLQHSGIYFTLQIIDPRLVGRAFNRLKAASVTTSDNNVLAYRWLPIDLDPIRPSGISSSDSELQLAMNMRTAVADYLSANHGLNNPIQACSGNGGHLLYKLPDLPNTPETVEYVKNILNDCSNAMEDPDVDIDTSVFNPARIWKLYGTTARKGDHVPANQYRAERPFRMSFVDDLGGLECF